MKGKKMTRCDDCRELFEYFDNDSEVMHHTREGKKLCSSCFKKVLRQARKEYIKGHPCPFKMKWAKIKTPDSGKEGPTLDWNDLIYCCRIMRGGGLDIKTGKMIETNECIGEENCPIYNGGIEKCNGK